MKICKSIGLLQVKEDNVERVPFISIMQDMCLYEHHNTSLYNEVKYKCKFGNNVS